MAISSLKEKVLHAGNGFRHHLPSNGNGRGQASGGPEEEIADKIDCEEVPSDDDGSGCDEDQAKPLGVFVNDENVPKLRHRYGELPLMQSRDDKPNSQDPTG